MGNRKTIQNVMQIMIMHYHISKISQEAVTTGASKTALTHIIVQICPTMTFPD